MKKGTLVYLANRDAENFCRSFMLEGAMEGGLGVAAASLPRHISLGMPYEVEDFQGYMDFAEEYAKEFSPITVRLTDMGCAPLGTATGNYCFRFETEADLDAERMRTVKVLREKLHLNVPEKDGVTGSRNITLGFGTAPYSAYEAFVEGADRSRFAGKELVFDELGVFYYDAPTISASTFCCVKRIPLCGSKN